MSYREACRLLNINRARGLESAKRRADLMLGTFAPDAPLRLKVAATTILATTPMQALASFDD